MSDRRGEPRPTILFLQGRAKGSSGAFRVTAGRAARVTPGRAPMAHVPVGRDEPLRGLQEIGETSALLALQPRPHLAQHWQHGADTIRAQRLHDFGDQGGNGLHRCVAGGAA